MDTFAEEYVYCFALNSKCHLMGMFEVSHGSVSMSVCQPREVFQKLLSLNAESFILVHNHPSGDATPSASDISSTERMKKCGEMMGIRMIDHIIIGAYNSYFSFDDSGLLDRNEGEVWA